MDARRPASPEEEDGSAHQSVSGAGGSHLHFWRPEPLTLSREPSLVYERLLPPNWTKTLRERNDCRAIPRKIGVQC